MKTRRLDSLQGVSERTGLCRKIISMTYVRRGRFVRNSHQTQADLFSWRPMAVFNPLDHVARKLAARFGISLAHADTVARLAGLGETRAGQ